MIHNMRLHPEPYNAIKNQTKTIEMRLNDEKRQQIKAGDFIEFINRQNSEKILTQVIKIHKFPNFQKLYSSFAKEALGYSLNEIANYQDMEKYYSKDEQKKYGVIGIEVKLIKKIYIIGPVASGKTTFAKKLAENYHLNYYELDKIVWDDEKKIKREPKDIKELFSKIIKKDNYVIEDVGRQIFNSVLNQVDIVFYLNISPTLLKFRILKRWIKQKLKLETSNYHPTLKSLFEMYSWLNKDLKVNNKLATIIQYSNNYQILKKIVINNDEIYF